MFHKVSCLSSINDRAQISQVVMYYSIYYLDVCTWTYLHKWRVLIWLFVTYQGIIFISFTPVLYNLLIGFWGGDL